MTLPLSTPPKVSIVLPTYNRSTFLPATFAAILAQGVQSWELLVVDDGSTDDTREVVARMAASVPQIVKYVFQANQGAYGARNTGVAMATGEYVAFYDSDDVWLPAHLPSCVGALDENADVDWVYAACELVNLESQQVLEPTSFYEQGRPRPFMALPQQVRGSLHVITSGGVLCQIEHGLFCGLQNSVLRRTVFERLRFEAALRNEAEDQLFAIRALAAGFHLAYFDAVHVRYQVHAENSSGPSADLSLAKRRKVYEPLIAGYERLESEVSLTPPERRAIRRRIGQELFWHLGYTGYWAAGDRRGALRMYGQALRSWPWDLSQWKTYVLALLKTSLGIGASNTATSSL